MLLYIIPTKRAFNNSQKLTAALWQENNIRQYNVLISNPTPCKINTTNTHQIELVLNSRTIRCKSIFLTNNSNNTIATTQRSVFLIFCIFIKNIKLSNQLLWLKLNKIKWICRCRIKILIFYKILIIRKILTQNNTKRINWRYLGI